MKRIILLLASFTIGILAFTQENYQDIIFLKNGEIIKGVIYEQIPNGILRICTADGDSLQYQTDEIGKLEREPVPCGKNSSGNNSWLKTGYHGIVEMGVSASILPNEFTSYVKMNFINGYRFNHWFFLGLGIGLRYPYIENNSYQYKGEPSPVFNDFGVPVFIDIRANLCLKKIKPFLALSSGYSFDMRDNDLKTRRNKYSLSQIKGVGFILSPSAGVSFIFSDKYAVNLGISFELQKFRKFMDGYNYYEARMVSTSRCLSINVGLSF